MVINTYDAHALFAHAKKCSKIVSVSFPGPFMSEFPYIRAHLAEGGFGGLGDLSVINGVCTSHGSKIKQERGVLIHCSRVAAICTTAVRISSMHCCI